MTKYTSNSRNKLSNNHLVFSVLALVVVLFFTFVLVKVIDHRTFFQDQAEETTPVHRLPNYPGIYLMKKGTVSSFFRTYYYWIFQDSKYPCGKQGNFQFVVLQKGNALDKRHLLVRFIGGFAGFYYAGSSGQLNYFPDASFQDLLYADNYTKTIAVRGVDRKIVDTNGWRIMSPSYCSHDLYLGTGQYNATDGFNRWGYLASQDAINYTQKIFSTDKMVMYGTSAGASGAFYQGLNFSNVSGIIMDSFAVDLQPLISACQQGLQPYYAKWPCSCAGETCVKTLAQRIGFNFNKVPYMLINDNKVQVPIYLIYDQNDYLYNSQAALEFNNLTGAINKNNPGGKSVVKAVCINNPALPNQTCNMHSPTLENNSASQDVYRWILSLIPK